MVDHGVMSELEGAKRITKIHENAKKEKIKNLEAYLNAAKDLGDVLTTFNEAAKNRELAAAGDNEKKKEEINKKYAKKEQTIAIAQAIINGALGITKIWAVTGVDPILAAIETAILAAETIAQIAVISSQKFDIGGYTPPGAWDQPQGVVHSDEFVANRYATRNKEVRPFLDVINMAQRTGTISTLNTETILRSVEVMRGGYAAGGYAPVAQPSAPMMINTDPEMKNILAGNMQIMAALEYQLRLGIHADAVLAYTDIEKKKKEVDGIRSRTTMS